MTITELNAWIDSRKLALGIKRDTEVVRRCGLPKNAVQNIRKARISGTHFPKIDVLEKLEMGLGHEPATGGGDGGEAALLAEMRVVKSRLEALEYALSVIRRER